MMRKKNRQKIDRQRCANRPAAPEGLTIKEDERYDSSKNYKFWFCTGSQDLYGDECLAHVAEHSGIIVDSLNKSGILPYEVVWKPTLITNELIRRTFNEANADEECAGVITWMHTFSPAKSWILGLQEYRKPLMHFHTQFNQEIPTIPLTWIS